MVTPSSSVASTLGSAKGNRSGRRSMRLILKGAVWFFLFLCGYQILWKYWLAGFVPDREIDKATGKELTRRQPDKTVKTDPRTGKQIPQTDFDGIMEGRLVLINIGLPPSGHLMSTATQNYTGVTATFCHISWEAQQQNPTTVPMFRDLKDKSRLCPSTTVTLDLHNIVQQARAFDEDQHDFAATEKGSGHGPVPPTAVIFHQSRCGSTLTANLFAAARPHQTRVYSEAPAPIMALMACHEDDDSDVRRRCDESAHHALIQDVFYMAGRTPGPLRPQYVFYKIQSSGSAGMVAFSKAMPDTPWVYVYRDPVEIMMSHFKHYQTVLDDSSQTNQISAPVNCLRQYQEGQTAPKALTEFLAQGTASNDTTAVALTSSATSRLSAQDYCAAHLASLALPALQVDRETADAKKTHRFFVNYRALPYFIWEEVLPAVVGPLSDREIDRMLHVAGLYAKNKDGDTRHFEADSLKKQAAAPEVIRVAAEKYMEPVYKELEAVRQDLDRGHHKHLMGGQ